MPTIYNATELSDEQREVLSSIVAIQVCESQPTREAIASFSGLSKNKTSEALKVLKSLGMIRERRVRDAR